MVSTCTVGAAGDLVGVLPASALATSEAVSSGSAAPAATVAADAALQAAAVGATVSVVCAADFPCVICFDASAGTPASSQHTETKTYTAIHGVGG